MEKFNLAIIGSGPGGYIAAIRAAQFGMKVAVVEGDKPGGVCLNWGCIPSKAILKCAELYETLKESEKYGIKCGELSYDYSKVIEKSRKAASTLSKGVEFLFKKNNITLFSGMGKLISQNKIRVKGIKSEAEIEAERILLATGSKPKNLGIEIDGKFVMTSDEAIISKEIPDSIIIIGAGAVGVEFAYIYNSFGSKVTIVEMEKQLIPGPGVDNEVRMELDKNFKKIGVKVFTNTKFKKIRKLDGSVEVIIEDTSGKEEKKLSSSKVLIAVGRSALIQELGIEDLNLELKNGFVKVDDSFMTTCKDIYAIGDVIGPPLLAHKASDEGVVAVELMSGLKSRKVHYDRIPSCIYCQPEVATIGITEDEAKEKGIKINVGRFPFKASGKAVATGETEGFVKIISDAKSGEILGSHIIGKGATELIAEIGLAKTLESTPLEIGMTVHAHPTLSEAIMEAALNALGMARNI
jgi:dihydrolipoamide dehydrogenase